MKKVFSDKATVSHLWAHQTQSEAKCGNLFYEGDTIYSYGHHFPIARKMSDGKVLFTLNGYSVSTAKHIGYVRSAASHLTKIYCYNFPYTASDKDAHAKNLNRWQVNFEALINKTAAARKPELYMEQMQNIAAQVKAYCDYFKVTLTKKQKAAFEIKDTEASRAIIAKQIAAKELFESQVKTKGQKLWNEFRQAWRDYKVEAFKKSLTDRQVNLLDTYKRTLINENTTYLRTNKEEVETSKEVKLPVTIAKRYYNWYMSICKRGGCAMGNCEGYKILDYEVNLANAKDGLTIGCHQIAADEISKLATKLGWVNSIKNATFEQQQA